MSTSSPKWCEQICLTCSNPPRYCRIDRTRCGFYRPSSARPSQHRDRRFFVIEVVAHRILAQSNRQGETDEREERKKRIRCCCCCCLMMLVDARLTIIISLATTTTLRVVVSRPPFSPSFSSNVVTIRRHYHHVSARASEKVDMYIYTQRSAR